MGHDFTSALRRHLLGRRLWFLARPPVDPVTLSLKNLGREIARTLAPRLEQVDVSGEPRVHGLTSKATTQRDIESPWFTYWCRQLHLKPEYRRKLWELAFVLQVLHERGMMRAGARGLGFACGEEPIGSYLASQGVEPTITDLDPEAAAGKGWMETGQHATRREHAFKPELVSQADFDRLASFRHLDMNAIPRSLDGTFDFCWSICAFEHLGSIENGLRFVEQAMRTLRPGGIAVHTTEFNYLGGDTTVEGGPTVLFLARHFLALKERLERAGHRVGPLDLDIGDGVADGHVDIPPYPGDVKDGASWAVDTVHLKLAVDGFPTTCFGIIVERG